MKKQFTVIIETESRVDGDDNYPTPDQLAKHIDIGIGKLWEDLEDIDYDVLSVKIAQPEAPNKPVRPPLKVIKGGKPLSIKQHVAKLQKEINKLNPYNPEAHSERMDMMQQIKVLQGNCVHKWVRGFCKECQACSYD